MKRITLKQLVIVVPVLAALTSAWYFAGARQARRDAIAVFDRCVEQNDALDLGWTIEQLGRGDTMLRIKDAAKENENIVFDGGVRFAQLLPENHDNGRGPADGYCLCGLGGSVGSAIWNGPAGMRISSLEFRGDLLRISIYGDLKIGTMARTIPRASPEVFEIGWPADSSDPPDHDLETMILARQDPSSPSAAADAG